MRRVTMHKYSYTYIKQTGSNVYSIPHIHSPMSLKCLPEMYLHEDQIFAFNHNLLLCNQAEEDLICSTVDRAGIWKQNINVSMNKMNGRVILQRRRGRKENV